MSVYDIESTILIFMENGVFKSGLAMFQPFRLVA